MEQAQAKFEGWAIVEMMGHQREIGFVTTQYFGGAAMFQIDCPELPEREYTLEKPTYCDDGSGYERLAPKGSKVRRQGVPPRSRVISPNAVYALNPCTEETARVAIERDFPRSLILLDVKDETKALIGETNPPSDETNRPCGCVGDELCEDCIDERMAK